MVSHLLLKTAKCACPATHISNLNPSAGIIPSQHAVSSCFDFVPIADSFSFTERAPRLPTRYLGAASERTGELWESRPVRHHAERSDALYAQDLFEDYYLPDIALSNCVTQAIEDGQVYVVAWKYSTVQRLASSLYRVFLAFWAQTSEVDGQQYSQPCRAVEADATRRATTRGQQHRGYCASNRSPQP